MQLVEKLADRILLMNRGREVLSGTVDEIRRKTQAATRLGLSVRGTADPAAFAGHPAVAGVESNGNGQLVLLLREGAVLSDLLVQAGSKLDVIEVHSERLTLHDIYVQALGDGAPIPGDEDD
jgi:ABC-2 type transport system ATP-binding protein